MRYTPSNAYLAPTSIIYSSPEPRCCVVHVPAPLLRQLGLDTERITVPFSNRVNMSYLAHVATVVVCVVCVCVCMCKENGSISAVNSALKILP